MWIEIRPEVFDEHDAKDLSALLSLICYQSRYSVYVDLPSVREKQVYSTLKQINGEAIEGFFQRFITESPPFSMVVSVDGDETGINLNQAISYLSRPVYLLVENSWHDEYFYSAVFRNFRRISKGINRAISHGWLKFENAGGHGNFENAVRALAKPFDNNIQALRIVALLDSDRNHPREPLSLGLVAILEFLKKEAIPYHVLEKREIENYLPDEAIAKIPVHKDFFKAYLRLTAPQKDYFDLEKGIEKNLNSLGAEIQAFFEGVSEADMAIFRSRKMAVGQDFKSEFPKYFDLPELTQESLLKRTKHQTSPEELRIIIQKINALL